MNRHANSEKQERKLDERCAHRADPAPRYLKVACPHVRDTLSR